MQSSSIISSKHLLIIPPNNYLAYIGLLVYLWVCCWLGTFLINFVKTVIHKSLPGHNTTIVASNKHCVRNRICEKNDIFKHNAILHLQSSTLFTILGSQQWSSTTMHIPWPKRSSQNIAVSTKTVTFHSFNVNEKQEPNM